MSNRIVRHSSRYKGPAGDSRPAAEIFDGIEARAQQAEPFRARLIGAMNDIRDNMTLTSLDGRVEAVREIVIDWLAKNHPEFMAAQAGEGGKGEAE